MPYRSKNPERPTGRRRSSSAHACSTPHCGKTQRRPAPHTTARTTPTCARTAARGTRPTYAAHQRRQAPPPRTHASAQAPTAHPRSTRTPRTQERPEHTRPGMHAVGPRKQSCLHMSAVRVRLWQQDYGQCTWHGIGRLSCRRHGDWMSGRGSTCGSLFFVLSHFDT